MSHSNDYASRRGPATTVDLPAPEARDGVTVFNPRFAIGPPELTESYARLINQPTLAWVEQHRLVRRLGSGGQGVVYLCERVGADQFMLPVALKFFSPEGYLDVSSYEGAMARMAQVAMRIALIQQDNLIDVHNLAAPEGVRILEMEFVDGYDLQALLSSPIYERLRESVSTERWNYLNDVIVTSGALQPRLKPGVAIAVLRDALAGLSALHREGIIHGDVKPSNVMLKRTGAAKLIDIGSAYEWSLGSPARTCTPAYAAPEVLDGDAGSPRSDLASLGYVLVELLSGAPPFAGASDRDGLQVAKRRLPGRLAEILPEEVACNELLMSLISGLIAPEPEDRFPDAEAADLVEQGAASFQRQLVHSNLASEYANEIRVWLEEVG
jgi:serine/threonine-protein kinase